MSRRATQTYLKTRAQLAAQIERACQETFRRKWEPPNFAGCTWLADAVLAVRDRRRAWSIDDKTEKALTAGRTYMRALLAAGRQDEATAVETQLFLIAQQRDPVLFLCEQVKARLAETNDGGFPTSPEKNGPLVKVVAELFDLTKIEPGQIPAKTVADILAGKRRKDAH